MRCCDECRNKMFSYYNQQILYVLIVIIHFINVNILQLFTLLYCVLYLVL